MSAINWNDINIMIHITRLSRDSCPDSNYFTLNIISHIIPLTWLISHLIYLIPFHWLDLFHTKYHNSYHSTGHRLNLFQSKYYISYTIPVTWTVVDADANESLCCKLSSIVTTSEGWIICSSSPVSDVTKLTPSTVDNDTFPQFKSVCSWKIHNLS